MGIKPPSGSKSTLPDAGEIRPLQYGRGVAALLVCLFHYEGAMNQIQSVGNAALGSTNFDFIFRAGHSGVEFFFILSGFIIFHAHRSDLGRPDRLGNFYRKRAIRILPMLWLIVIPFGLAVLAISSRGVLTLGKLLLDILLIPREGTLTLPAAWTLQHEVVFYLLFGFLILNKRLGMVVLALWQLACLVVLLFNLLPQDYLLPATTYLGYYNFGFLFGIAIALLRGRVELGAHRRAFLVLGGVGLVGLLTCFIGEWRIGSTFFPSPAASTLIYLGFYSLVILALLSLENKPRPILDATLGALGGASYILYIIHEPLYSVLDKVFLLSAPRTFMASMTTFLLSVAVAVAISVLMYYGIERPTLRELRRRLLPSSRPIKAMTAA
jgi:peptidoglycan/LPS O-acetylase OafA/YrhL